MSENNSNNYYNEAQDKNMSSFNKAGNDAFRFGKNAYQSRQSDNDKKSASNGKKPSKSGGEKGTSAGSSSSKGASSGSGKKKSLMALVIAVVVAIVLYFFMTYLLPHSWMTYDNGKGYMSADGYQESYDEIADLGDGILHEYLDPMKEAMEKDADKRVKELIKEENKKLENEHTYYLDGKEVTLRSVDIDALIDVNLIDYLPVYFDEEKLKKEFTAYVLSTNQTIYASERLDDTLAENVTQYALEKFLHYTNLNTLVDDEYTTIGLRYEDVVRDTASKMFHRTPYDALRFFNIEIEDDTDRPVIIEVEEPGKQTTVPTQYACRIEYDEYGNYWGIEDPNGPDLCDGTTTVTGPSTTKNVNLLDENGEQVYYKKIKGQIIGTIYYDYSFYKQNEYKEAKESYYDLFGAATDEDKNVISARVDDYFLDLYYVATDIKYEKIDDVPAHDGFPVEALLSTSEESLDDFAADPDVWEAIQEYVEEYKEYIFDFSSLTGDILTWPSSTGQWDALDGSAMAAEIAELSAAGIIDATPGPYGVGWQCTTWAKYFIYKTYGAGYGSNQAHGNGIDFASHLSGSSTKWELSDYPVAGSVFSVAGGYTTWEYGHVGFISKVDGDTIWICDGNIHKGPNGYSGLNVRINAPVKWKDFLASYGAVWFAVPTE